VQPLHLPIAVGSVGSTSHVFYLECSAQSVKLALEFRPVICPDLSRVPKDLKNLLFNSISNRFAVLVLYQSQHAEFAETTNGT
jgi:hypothetical protein